MYCSKQINLVSKVLKNNKTNYWTGDHCIKFEKEFSKYNNTKYSIAVSNGSVALEIALKSLNLKKDDKIIVTSRSFIISASCTLNLGLKPVFSDVDENGNVNINNIISVYNNKVKAIILVHLNGLSCDLDPIIKFAKLNKIFLIEDCSQAHGAKYKNKPVGSFGDISTWSFCQDKIISTGGEGGMISTNNKKIWRKCWEQKDHGKNFKKIFKKNKKKNFGQFNWIHDNLGSNYRMTEMQAALGRIQLEKLDKQITKRNKIVDLYLLGLKDFFDKKIFKTPNFQCDSCEIKKFKIKCNYCVHAFYRLNLFFKKTNLIKRSKILKRLINNGIKCGVGPCPEIYREKIFKKLKFNEKNRLINAKKLGETSIIFYINPNKSLVSIKKEILLIKKIIKNF